eukprot:scaffold4723_cov172-Amphora_coffeaeformis.AAC.2
MEGRTRTEDLFFTLVKEDTLRMENTETGATPMDDQDVFEETLRTEDAAEDVMADTFPMEDAVEDVMADTFSTEDASQMEDAVEDMFRTEDAFSDGGRGTYGGCGGGRFPNQGRGGHGRGRFANGGRGGGRAPLILEEAHSRSTNDSYGAQNDERANKRRRNNR